MKVGFKSIMAILIINGICWYYFKSSDNFNVENEQLRAQLEELEFQSGRKKNKNNRTISSIKHIKKESIGDQSKVIEIAKKEKLIFNQNEKSQKFIQDNYDKFTPEVIEMMQSKDGQKNLYKHFLKNPEMLKKLDKIQELDKSAGAEVKDFFSVSRIEKEAASEKILQDKNDVPPSDADRSDEGSSNDSKSNSQMKPTSK